VSRTNLPTLLLAVFLFISYLPSADAGERTSIDRALPLVAENHDDVSVADEHKKEAEGADTESEPKADCDPESNGKHKENVVDKEDNEEADKKETAAEKKEADKNPKEKEKPKKKEDPRAKHIAEMETEMKELKAKAALEMARQDAELSAMKLEMARLAAETGLESARRKKATASFGLETDLLIAENALLKQKLAKLKQASDIANLENTAKMSKTKQEIALADSREKAKSRVLSELEYKSNPFKGGELCITDRRIPLNGAITSTTATYIAERIHFFNNLSEDPIFIVIDSSPGGSVMAGYRILKSMEASDAPVHVVVKSYAASMAAIITTMADDSYAYPNAIILHHQMSTFMGGNMTEHAEQLEVAKEWARRIMEPLAEKIGTTPEQFVKDMYANNSTGDWEEFADRAHELKWVANVVPRIREESVLKKPADKSPGSKQGIVGSVIAPVSFDGTEETDERGVRFKRLPRLQPYDFYFVHNPDDYYRY